MTWHDDRVWDDEARDSDAAVDYEWLEDEDARAQDERDVIAQHTPGLDGVRD